MSFSPYSRHIQERVAAKPLDNPIQRPVSNRWLQEVPSSPSTASVEWPQFISRSPSPSRMALPSPSPDLWMGSCGRLSPSSSEVILATDRLPIFYNIPPPCLVLPATPAGRRSPQAISGVQNIRPPEWQSPNRTSSHAEVTAPVVSRRVTRSGLPSSPIRRYNAF